MNENRSALLRSKSTEAAAWSAVSREVPSNVTLGTPNWTGPEVCAEGTRGLPSGSVALSKDSAIGSSVPLSAFPLFQLMPAANKPAEERSLVSPAGTVICDMPVAASEL